MIAEIPVERKLSYQPEEGMVRGRRAYITAHVPGCCMMLLFQLN